jgi:hypothetical protein
MKYELDDLVWFYPDPDEGLGRRRVPGRVAKVTRNFYTVRLLLPDGRTTVRTRISLDRLRPRGLDEPYREPRS